MNLKKCNPGEQRGFKIVCESCGSLSIKVNGHGTDAPDAALVECGRCSGVRGTLADLHALARGGRDVFEF